jgi:methylmalonyl-CoA/ethylmalonyl-CoA epimerase
MLSLLGYTIGESIYDPLQRVSLIWCRSNNQPDVEIICPSGAPNPIEKILVANGEIIYHTCYATNDLSTTLHRLTAHGFRLLPLVDPMPAALFGNKKVSFYRIAGFGTIEILEDEDLGMI